MTPFLSSYREQLLAKENRTQVEDALLRVPEINIMAAKRRIEFLLSRAERGNWASEVLDKEWGIQDDWDWKDENEPNIKEE